MSDTSAPLRIIAYRGDRSACWFYRIHAPLIYVAKNNQKTMGITIASGITTENTETAFDLIIAQRQYSMEVLSLLLEMKKKGAKIVYEVDDDLFNIPAWNAASKQLNTKSVQNGIRTFLHHCDAMFVTTESLVDVYKEYCPIIHVLPNAIDPAIVFKYPRNTKIPVVCWHGSMTHERDLHIARAGFSRLAQDKDVILKMWCGVSLETKQPVFEIPGAQHLPLVPFEAFYQMLSQLDISIGLAPLSTAPFNRSKSNLKFLEYTAIGAVTVASAVGPYKDTITDGVNGILVSDNRDWYDKVRMLIDNPDLYATILKNAETLLSEKYDISKNYVLWEAAIHKIVGR